MKLKVTHTICNKHFSYHLRSSSDKAHIFPSWHDKKTSNFQIALMFLKLVWFGSKICIVSIEIRFHAIHHLQSHENLRFLNQP